MKYNVLDVSRFILNYSINKKTPISNLVLQKILYYVQATFLVEKNEICFKEDIINWAYGPVVLEAYNEYRDHGRNKIEDEQNQYEEIDFDDDKKELVFRVKNFDDNCINEEDKKIIENVVNIYTTDDYYKNPFALVNKTHNESPWKDTCQNEKISIEKIKDYYNKNVDKLLGE